MELILTRNIFGYT